MRYLLEPEVAGELGPETEMDSSVHPPVVSRLQYEVHGWLGDDIVESFPCFVVTKRLGDLLTEAELTGFKLGSVDVVVSDETEDLADSTAVVPEFLWLQVDENQSGDFGLDESGRLVVSERALDIMREVNLDNCDIEEVAESA